MSTKGVQNTKSGRERCLGKRDCQRSLFKRTAELYQENRNIRRGMEGSRKLCEWRNKHQKMNSTGESFRQTQNSTMENNLRTYRRSQKFEIN